MVADLCDCTILVWLGEPGPFVQQDVPCLAKITTSMRSHASRITNLCRSASMREALNASAFACPPFRAGFRNPVFGVLLRSTSAGFDIYLDLTPQTMGADLPEAVHSLRHSSLLDWPT